MNWRMDGSIHFGNTPFGPSVIHLAVPQPVTFPAFESGDSSNAFDAENTGFPEAIGGCRAGRGRVRFRPGGVRIRTTSTRTAACGPTVGANGPPAPVDGR